MPDATLTVAPPTGTPRRRPRSRTGWALVTLTSLAVAGYSLALYAQGTLEAMAEAEIGLADNYAATPGPVQAAFFAHVVTGALALLLGPWQFSHRLRGRHRPVHRGIGRAYLLSVALASLTALVMAPFNSAGMVGFFGFGTLAVLWAFTAWRGYRAVRRRDFAEHEAWMIRNYALTYAAPALRLWLAVLIFVQVPFAAPGTDFQALFDNAYYAVPFLCWLPNLVVAEWLVRRRGLPPAGNLARSGG
ncbi:DUF2306 domain-containing protein [Polymorphospora sp. NPDC051019]|uniref:DUF2306 domain-containing protein n=1 Tax=Polymorphospora sp. NPDC051019 TaxID=3155725 RepID=UPI003430DD29